VATFNDFIVRVDGTRYINYRRPVVLTAGFLILRRIELVTI